MRALIIWQRWLRWLFRQWLIPLAQATTLPPVDDTNIGFRVASIPEPCTLLLLLGVGGVLIRKR